MSNNSRGFFIIGTDTDVGKTYIGSLLARNLVQAGHRVGVYKPAASGCRRVNNELIPGDPKQLWEAAGRPGNLNQVCPQCFEAPLAPHLAAKAEGKQIDRELLRRGFDPWRNGYDFLIVEGVGGLLSPLSDQDYVADLAFEFRLPLILVARNALGTINHTLLTLHAARSLYGGMPIAGIILNQTSPNLSDQSLASNYEQIQARSSSLPILSLPYGATDLTLSEEWFRFS